MCDYSHLRIHQYKGDLLKIFMQVKQFENKNLSHFSYAILSDCEKKIILIDPSRDPQHYLDFARDSEATITGVIETHPHADFVSSHLEFHEIYKASIYTSILVEAQYPYHPFDEGKSIQLGKIKLTSINTPGHSPDSICILLEHEGKQKMIFTGDTLFIGDCGRPDLRPDKEHSESAAKKLARQMYYSLREKIMTLYDDNIIYPAHGAGTLCGKALSDAKRSTLVEEKKNNWSLQNLTEDEFIKELLQDQPFVPAYFTYDVSLNKKGVKPLLKSIGDVPRLVPIKDEASASHLNSDLWIIDGRAAGEYKKGHLDKSVNLQIEGKFETWLGSIIQPGEKFYLANGKEKDLDLMISRVASIGYEYQVEGAFIINYSPLCEEELDMTKFKEYMNDYTIIDVRNRSQVKDKKIFAKSISMPLGDLRSSIKNIPIDKPIVVHCASGYRSAVGSSMIQSVMGNKVKVFDLSERVKQFIGA